jgi:hypothetical protein
MFLCPKQVAGVESSVKSDNQELPLDTFLLLISKVIAMIYFHQKVLTTQMSEKIDCVRFSVD